MTKILTFNLSKKINNIVSNYSRKEDVDLMTLDEFSDMVKIAPDLKETVIIFETDRDIYVSLSFMVLLSVLNSSNSIIMYYHNDDDLTSFLKPDQIIPIMISTDLQNEENHIAFIEYAIDKIKKETEEKSVDEILLNENYVLNLNNKSVQNDKGHIAYLTSYEFTILKTLAQNPGKPLDREELVKALFPKLDQEVDFRIIDSHVSAIRNKTFPDIIKTRRGVGYFVDNA